MVNQDILGALKSALSRNNSLEQTKQTLFNAGYDRTEIEETCKSLNQPEQISENKIMQESAEQKNSSSPSEEKTNPKKKDIMIISIGIAVIVVSGILIYFFLK